MRWKVKSKIKVSYLSWIQGWVQKNANEDQVDATGLATGLIIVATSQTKPGEAEKSGKLKLHEKSPKTVQTFEETVPLTMSILPSSEDSWVVQESKENNSTWNEGKLSQVQAEEKTKQTPTWAQQPPYFKHLNIEECVSWLHDQYYKSVNEYRNHWVGLKALERCLETQLTHAMNYHLVSISSNIIPINQYHESVHKLQLAIELGQEMIRQKLPQQPVKGTTNEAIEIIRIVKVDLATDDIVQVIKKACYHGFWLVKKINAVTTSSESDYATDVTNGKSSNDSLDISELDAVPQLCLRLCGPDRESIEAAQSLRWRILASWTISIKELGQHIIDLILAMMVKWNSSRGVSLINVVKKIPDISRDKASLQGTLHVDLPHFLIKPGKSVCELKPAPLPVA
ncbi:hypothetical protein Ciccas_004359 [Cichlidogyrus casuarinus]|uniref:Uncharacterized protein n=1 Tax=Cichlidogyrus casuarinus TaxID=1844966 RepID=A0ABD2QCP5_9PLAT